MKRLWKQLPLVVATTLALGAADGSSHREAPFITEQPKVDGTDFYMFNSYEPGREGYVTLIANYLPLQDPYGGPNYFTMDPEAVYDIHIDNNGNAKPDITFRFKFKQNLRDIKINSGGKDVSVPLINVGSISEFDDNAQNVTETYTVEVVRGGRGNQFITNVANGDKVFTKPVDNIGTKSIPDYDRYAASFLYDVSIPNCGSGRLFVGQRKDPFVVNLGEVFDLINTNPVGPPDGEKDDLADKNVTSLVLEVPSSCLARSNEPVIGAWTTASLPQVRLIDPRPGFSKPTVEVGPYTQVSRLGMPLVNEIVIGLKDKNLFNASQPKDDARFANYVTNPTLPALIEALFPSAPAPTLFPRQDLVATFLTGIKIGTTNLNQPAKVVPAEMLRLNTTVPATARDSQNNLGVIGGDLAGYPNGRRPGDDVVDISLRVVMGKLISAGLYGNPTQAPAGTAPLTDGATVDATAFGNAFPYLNSPLPGAGY